MLEARIFKMKVRAHFISHPSLLFLIFALYFLLLLGARYSTPISIIRGSSNGRTTGSGPVNRGSSPCPRALLKNRNF